MGDVNLATATKIPQVAAALDELGNAIVDLDKEIAELGEKLKPVRVMTSPIAVSPEPALGSRCLIAKVILEKAGLVESMIRTVKGLRAEIEI